MERKSIVVGNWKMHKTHRETEEFIKALAPKVNACRSSVYLAVPFTSLYTAIESSKNTNIIIGAQNMHDEIQGAFTGEISAVMLKTLGAEFVIIGHSERRHIFKENDSFINKKILRALKTGLVPILCIGETLEQRQNKQTEKILEQQIKKGLFSVPLEDLKNVIIAYEPVWAIGTGKTATAKIAEYTHKFIREILANSYNKNISNDAYILYGGSVKSTNVKDLIQQENIDGLLVGGGSLDIKEFANIVNKA